MRSYGLILPPEMLLQVLILIAVMVFPLMLLCISGYREEDSGRCNLIKPVVIEAVPIETLPAPVVPAVPPAA